MDLFEYQGKSLYENYDIAHPNSFLINEIEDLNQGFHLTYPVVVKAQVQVGGRGKAGGIKLANNREELSKYSNDILGMDIKGHICLLYTSPSPRDNSGSRMPSSA